MSKIDNFRTTIENEIEVEFPDIDGFKLKLVYLDRDELIKLRKHCVVFKFNKGTRQREEEINDDKFLELYSEKVIKGWSGLKTKHLPTLLPVDISGANPEELVTYNPEEALSLLKHSNVIDQFITDCMNDFELFSIQKKEQDVKN